MDRFGFGFTFDDFHDRDGLVRLDAAFVAALRRADAALADRLLAARAAPGAIDAAAESQLLLDLAPHVDGFIAALFAIAPDCQRLAERHVAFAPLAEVKRNFVQRLALKQVKPEDAGRIDGPRLAKELAARFGEPCEEAAFARHVLAWSQAPDANAEKLALARDYAAWATLTAAGQARHGGGVLFKQPGKVDHQRLIRPLASSRDAGVARHRLGEDHLRRRDGFKLTDPGTDLPGALDQANYCIWCHYQGKDSCAKGLREKVSGEKSAAGAVAPFKRDPNGVQLAGCPLEEKISEMHVAKVAGQSIAALAIAVVDNPMLAATGHRICNDCMKACIFQRQEPVNIPQVETRVLKDVLALPYGFEIYSLLTRWNPLNLRRPVPLPPSGRRVLIAGMGPAGFTLAHHLLNDGHTVVGADGLKIEPLPAALSGVTAAGERVPFAPVRDARALWDSLDERLMYGFGGVAEYGITIRWDKNYLKLVRLLLERRRGFALFGGVRLGGTVDIDGAFALGFDHVALALGAGGPTVLDLPNGLARGVRAASDFLMALQLTGAAKADSIANMQLRLPVVVVGGGLTAIDTATESLAYYPLQVEKFLARYETLASERGEAKVRAAWDAEEAAIADEFLAHGRALRLERAAAAKENRPPRLRELVQAWGGVTIAYRRRLVDSPSYTLNHEEVEKALEEGVVFAEGLTPASVAVDHFGHAEAMTFTTGEGRVVTLPARAVLVAAGTQPNTVLARENPAGPIKRAGRSFQAYDEAGDPVTPEPATAKPNAVRVLAAKRADGRYVSYFGDVHPSYFGSVVKAMGSAKQGYPVVSRLLVQVKPADAADQNNFLARLNDQWRARVERVERLTPNIVEVVVRAPQAARQFQPGQFYRLQNFESNAAVAAGTRLAMEGLAMTGAWVDKARGLLAFIVLEMGGSSDLCALLKPGEPVVAMGPTGSPSEIPAGETVLLAGGGLGNAVLFSIGQAMRAKDSKVLYFAGYRRAIDRFKVAEIEAAADAVVWCCDQAPGFRPTRPQDRSFVGNMVQAIEAYAAGRLGETPIAVGAADRIVAIGSDRMMAALAQARHGVLRPYLKPGHAGIGSINSPMQCMMKEICAQCLQPQIDPATGARSCVFSCFNQDQPLDAVDWPALAARLRQNSVQEKLTAQWIDRCLVQINVRQRVA
jgi:NADPH-dependent glutamate synthase beta subunit-like oxidoreductase/NAD(P)H-flavin reductase